MSARRRLFVPEILQTSGMDCGPASLKALLAGLGVPVNYERLRDACRTGADGTSIDALEDLCDALGLEAFQEMAPIADAFSILTHRAPCIVVVKGAGGAPHFVVVWRVLAGLVQIMDPAEGRRWLTKTAFMRELHVHAQPFDPPTFSEWFATTAWSSLFERRAERLGAPRGFSFTSLAAREVGALDGSLRLADRLVERGVLDRRSSWTAVGELARMLFTGADLPSSLRVVREGDEGRLVVHGAVFLVVRRSESAGANGDEAQIVDRHQVLGADGPSVYQVLAQYVTRNARRLLALTAILSAMLVLLAFAEMVVLRAAFDAQNLLTLAHQRFVGAGLYFALVAVMLVVEGVIGFGVARLGRAAELRMRVALLEKLPRLPDRYFRSRPLSDVTHRSQGLFDVRPLPGTIISLVKLALDIVVTSAALLILHPRGAPWILLALAFGLLAPLASLRLRRQVEERVQSHASELGQLYLDVLLGLVPLRSHGGQPALRAKQAERLVAWRRESDRAMRLFSSTEVAQSWGVLLGIVLILSSYVERYGSQAGLMLVAFWALRLPLEARALTSALLRVPRLFASIARVIEPLTATETPPAESFGEQTMVLTRRPGIALRFRDVGVTLGANRVLSNLTLEIPAGQRVAIVGSSGAGKSSVFALLLGLVERDSGDVVADGLPIESYDLGRFRRETVWIDPSVQLWNRSLLRNLQFGNPETARHPVEQAIDDMELGGVIERMPEGLATELGESGARVSGGEGQRVRASRAILRRGARLWLLDEAFRGLDRPARRRLSRVVRARAGEATVLEVTHDVADTFDFDRVLVIEDGRLVEDGAPQALMGEASRYAALVHADRSVQEDIWGADGWKRLTVDRGTVLEDASLRAPSLQAPSHG